MRNPRTAFAIMFVIESLALLLITVSRLGALEYLRDTNLVRFVHLQVHVFVRTDLKPLDPFSVRRDDTCISNILIAVELE